MESSQSSPLISYQTYKESNYESKTIQLTSPMLHIGGEVSRLNPFEYVQTSSKVYLPNQAALTQALYKQGGSFLQDYIDDIENNRSIKNLLEQAWGENWVNQKSPDGVRIFADGCPKWTQEEGQNITELRPMIRNGIGQLYIPGSSIKGAIRTAIAYHVLKHSNRYSIPSGYHVSAIEQKLRDKLSSKQLGNQKKLDDDLFMNKIFTNYSLYSQNRDFTPKTGANTDILRAIKVSDSQPLLEQTLTNNKTGKKRAFNCQFFAEVIVSSHCKDWKAKYRASIYAEIVHNVRTEFTLTLDKEMLSWFRHRQDVKLPFSTLNDLLEICHEFAQDQWNNEVNYWQNIKNNRHQGKNLNFDLIWDNYYTHQDCPYNLRIGWGTGMMGTTIDSLFQEDTKSELRDACGIAAPDYEAPKSRRTIVNSKRDIRYVPGWVNLKVL